MFDGVESSLKIIKFLLQHLWMLQGVACIWPTPSQHDPTINVARCFNEMLRALSLALLTLIDVYTKK